MAQNNDLNFNSLPTFEKLFDDYYTMLCVIACDIVKNKQVAEELVDEVFVNLWFKRDSIQVYKSIRAYLIKSVQNRCFNWLEQSKHERLICTNEYEISIFDSIKWSDDYPLGNLLEKELQNVIQKSVEALPAQCKTIFLLNRDQELTYQEISIQLNISVNTVKTQMKIALSKLRDALQDYLPLLLFLIISR
jgi:RNA polymerase sigma-70 factor, ECF subfamily